MANMNIISKSCDSCNDSKNCFNAHKIKTYGIAECASWKPKEKSRVALIKYSYELKELFDSENQAVVSYLSLERRYMELCHRHRELNKQIEMDYIRKPESDCRYKFTKFQESGA